jgi:hypothetical protein
VRIIKIFEGNEPLLFNNKQYEVLVKGWIKNEYNKPGRPS